MRSTKPGISGHLETRVYCATCIEFLGAKLSNEYRYWAPSNYCFTALRLEGLSFLKHCDLLHQTNWIVTGHLAATLLTCCGAISPGTKRPLRPAGAGQCLAMSHDDRLLKPLLCSYWQNPSTPPIIGGDDPLPTPC